MYSLRLEEDRTSANREDVCLWLSTQVLLDACIDRVDWNHRGGRNADMTAMATCSDRLVGVIVRLTVTNSWGVR